MTEASDVIIARIDQRLIVVERDVREIKEDQRFRRPSWPAILSSLAAFGALVLVIIERF